MRLQFNNQIESFAKTFSEQNPQAAGKGVQGTERKQQLEKLFKDNLPKGVPKATKKILEKAAENFAEALQNYYEMPCALGDTVTDIKEYFDGTENPQMYSFVATKISLELDGDEIVYLINNEVQYKKEDFNKTVFFGSDGLKKAEKARDEKVYGLGDWKFEFDKGGRLRREAYEKLYKPERPDPFLLRGLF